jgi:hypothetical protein
VEEKPSDKLNSRDGGLFNGIAFSIFVPEGHHIVFKGDEATVCNGHPMGIAGDVLKYVVGLTDGIPYTDHPLFGI